MKRAGQDRSSVPMITLLSAVALSVVFIVIIFFSGLVLFQSDLDLRQLAELVSPTPFLPASNPSVGSASPNPKPTSSSQPTITPTLTPVPTPTFTPVPAWAINQIASMSLSQKIGQLIMTGVSGQWMTAETCQLIQRISPGGIVFARSNAANPEQLRQFSADLKGCSERVIDIPLLMAIDHEGQYVTRFQSGATVFPAALAQGATGDPSLSYQAAYAAGLELSYSGANTVLGPVADLLTNYDNTVISQRSFGGDQDQVGAFVSQAVLGYQAAGVIPVLKHFPGHGGVSADSHHTKPIDAADLALLSEQYLVPFENGLAAGAPIVMFSHVAFPALDPAAEPATLSPPVVRLLRDRLGFEGIILTDSLSMGAITESGLSVSEAAVRAVQTGVDMLLITSPQQAQVTRDRLLEAVKAGEISIERVNEAVGRILGIKFYRILEPSRSPASALPDWNANSNLSYTIGYQSVSVLRDRAELLPIPPDKKNILIIGPPDGWGLYPILLAALREHGHTPTLIRYSGPWDGPVPETGYLQSLPAQAEQFDLVIMLTWEAHINRFRYNDIWQIQLVNELLEGATPVVVAALRSPTDILEFEDAPTFLATFGTTRGQVQALADALVTSERPTGQNPLPDLP